MLKKLADWTLGITVVLGLIVFVGEVTRGDGTNCKVVCPAPASCTGYDITRCSGAKTCGQQCGCRLNAGNTACACQE